MADEVDTFAEACRLADERHGNRRSILNVETDARRALQVFHARLDALAILFGCGEYPDMEAATARLLDDAFRDGIIDLLGEATVMQMIDSAFAPFWEPEPQ